METRIDGGSKVGNLPTLSAQLRDVELEHVKTNDGTEVDAREELVEALGLYHTSRYAFGRALVAYKTMFIEERGWMVVVSLIAKTIGRDESTVRRIVRDYERASQLPAEITAELAAQGIDAAAKKHAPLISNLLTLPVSAAPSDPKAVVTAAVEEVKAVKAEKRAKTATKPSLSARASGDTVIVIKTPAERLRCDIRSKVRAALGNVAPDRKLTELIDALQEEMYEVWGITEPVDITLTPTPSAFTLDGRRKLESAA